MLSLSFKSRHDVYVVLCSCFLFYDVIRYTLFFAPNDIVLVVGYSILKVVLLSNMYFKFLERMYKKQVKTK